MRIRVLVTHDKKSGRPAEQLELASGDRWAVRRGDVIRILDKVNLSTESNSHNLVIHSPDCEDVVLEHFFPAIDPMEAGKQAPLLAWTSPENEDITYCGYDIHHPESDIGLSSIQAGAPGEQSSAIV